MSVVISRTVLNENVRWLLKDLEDEHLLHKLFTTLAVSAEHLGRFPLLKYRACPLPAKRICCFPVPEMLRWLAYKTPLASRLTRDGAALSSFKVGVSLDRAVSAELKGLCRQGANVFYGYEDASLHCFERARILGMQNVYELTIAYWELSSKLLQEEVQRLPEWAGTINVPSLLAEKIERKTRELELADLIICPSNFVVSSLPEIKGKVLMVPFGTPPLPALSSQERTRKTKGPLKVLFVGSMSQRKGLADLFQAINLLNRTDVELIVVGAMQAPMEFYKSKCQFTYMSTCTHNEVLNLMRQCHVFCLPSIVEGRALVQQEAMAAEMPLIISPNTGCDDLVDDGNTGFVVAARSAESIAEKINWCADNRESVIEMGINARNKAYTVTWNSYATRIADGIRNLSSRI